MAEQVRRLSDMSIDEVSFVDRGANQHADLLISKRDEEPVEKNRSNPEEYLEDDEDEVEKSSPAAGDLHSDKPLDDEDEEEKSGFQKFLDRVSKAFPFGQQNKPPGLQGPPMAQAPSQPVAPQPQMAPAGLPPQQNPQAPQMAPQMPGAAPGLQPGMPPGLPQQQAADPAQGLAPLPQEVVDYIRELEKQVQNLSQGSGGSGATNGENPFGKSEEFEDMADDTALLEELAKSLETEEQREAIYKALDLVAEAEERAAAAEEIAKAEREHRLNREYVELAKRYQHLPISPEEFGPVLKRLHENMTAEDIEVIEKVLNTVDDEMTGLFTEVGKRGGYESSIHSRVEAEAAEIAKSAGVSRETAIEQVLESNPRLYDEYVRESATAAREV